jgi:hypothetical protein
VIRALFLGVVLLAASYVACGAGVSDRDAAAIRAVVSEQLDAFARDDARRAFSLATQGIRAQFGSAEAFMAMVRSDYAVVYRPRKVEFDKPAVIDGAVMQPVKMIDAQGTAWIAVYPMQRQANGRWRINGCQVARLAERQV